MSDYELSCPHCLAIIKPAKLPPAGARVRCPFCKEPFVVEDAHIMPASAPSAAPAAKNVAPTAPTRRSPGPGDAPAPALKRDPDEMGLPAAVLVGGGVVGTLAIVLLAWLGYMVLAGSEPEVAQAPPLAPPAGAAPTPTTPPAVIESAPTTDPAKQQTSAETPRESAVEQPTAKAKDASNPMPTVATVTPATSKSTEQPKSTDPIKTAKKNKPAPPPTLKYELKPEYNYEYKYSLAAGSNGKTPLFNGNVIYSLAQEQIPRVPKLEDAIEITQQASATAFIVSAQGHLISCAHVVEDAKQIDVIFDKATHVAEVVATDDANDLALLKIDATNYLPLPVANANVRQGADVRVVGFPLSDILGNSIKINYGRIAGAVEKDGESLLQVDASANPGNSGGPLVNDEGKVIGVITSGVFGAEIDRVTLALRVDALRQFLSDHGVNVDAAGTIPDDDFAKRMQQSVARVRVTKNVGKPTDTFVVRFFGGLSSPSGEGRGSEGTTTLSMQGASVSVDSKNDVSLLGTSVSSLAFEQLPKGKRYWTAERTRTVTSVDEIPIFSEPSYRDRLPPRMRASLPRTRSTLPGTRSSVTITSRTSIRDRINYEIAELTDEKVVVNFQIESSWIGMDADEQAAALAGTGQYTFDRTQGVISKGYIAQKMQAESSGVAVSLPLQLTFTLESALTAKEVKQRSDERKAKQAAEDSKQMEQALVTLRDQSSNKRDVQSAFTKLMITELSNEQKQEVSQLLEHWLKSSDTLSKFSIHRAAAKFATKQNLPTLLELLKTDPDRSHHNLIEAIGTTGGDEESAKILAALLDSNDRFAATQALKKMGSFAEDAVLPLLESKDKESRDTACDVLGEAGGKKSLDALEAMLVNVDERDFTQFRVKMARDQVKKRVAVGAK